MIFYFGFLLLLILLKVFRIEEKQGVKFLFFFLAILLAFRSWDLGLYDTLNYRNFFYAFQCEPISFIVHNNYYKAEVLMSVFTWITAKIFSEFGGFVITAAFIYIFSVYKFVLNWSQNKYLSTLFFFSIYYFYGFYLIKQTLAMSLLLFSFTWLNQNKYWRAFLFVVFAILVHKYAWVVLIAYPTIGYFRKIKRKIMAFSIFVGIGIFIPNIINKLVITLDPTNLLEKYMALGIYNRNAARLNLAMIIYILIAIFGMLVQHRNNICVEEKREYEVFMSLSICAAVFSSYSMIIQEFYRVAAFFGLFNIVFITKIFKQIKLKRNAQMAIFIVYVFLMLYSFRTASNMNCIHYKFFFDDSIRGHFLM